MSTTNKLERFAGSIADNFNWTNTFGLGRTVLAVGSIITLLLNNPGMLVTPLGELVVRDSNLFVSKLSIFYLLSDHLFWAKWISIALLFVVASGWRPRFTAVFHWWVAYSIATSCMVVDGGDQIASVLTLILIPFCLADGRKWHWTFVEGKSVTGIQRHFNILGAVSYFFIRLQIAYIYFHAGIGKTAVEEWMNGTAIYYWSQSPLFEMPAWLSPILTPLFAFPLTITIFTWSIMAFELILFLGLVMSEKWRPLLLKAGLAFHFMIILLYGLVTFFFTMAGCLILFVGPKKGFDFLPKTWKEFKALFNKSWLQLPSRQTLAPEISAASSNHRLKQ